MHPTAPPNTELGRQRKLLLESAKMGLVDRLILVMLELLPAFIVLACAPFFQCAANLCTELSIESQALVNRLYRCGSKRDSLDGYRVEHIAAPVG